MASQSKIIAILVVISFALGLARDIVVANAFGTSIRADILFLALMLPVFFENIAGIALRDAAIENLKCVSNDESRAKRAGLLYGKTIVFSIIVVIILYFNSKLLISILVPGWSEEQKHEAHLPFLIGIAIIFSQSIYYCQSAILNVHERFVIPNWRPIIVNLTVLLLLAVISTVSPEMLIAGMAISQIVVVLFMHGKVSQDAPISVSIEAIKPWGVKLNSFVPLIMVAFTQQAWFLAERWHASDMPEGTITLLTLSFRIVTIPQTILAFSLFAILYPLMIQLSNSQKDVELANIFRRGQQISLAFVVPVSVVFIGFSESVIQTLLQRGAFSQHATISGGLLLSAYAWGLPATVLSLFWGRCLLAIGKYTYFYVGAIVGVLVSLAISHVLIKEFQAEGLPIAFALGNWLVAIMYGHKIRREVKNSVSLLSILRWIIAGLILILTCSLINTTGASIYLWSVLVSISVVAVAMIQGERIPFSLNQNS